MKKILGIIAGAALAALLLLGTLFIIFTVLDEEELSNRI
jgi:hypothetical protein